MDIKISCGGWAHKAIHHRQHSAIHTQCITSPCRAERCSRRRFLLWCKDKISHLL